MRWWKLESYNSLAHYCLGFAIMWPPLSLIPVAVLRLIFHLPITMLVIAFLLMSASMIFVGAPTLYWAHKRSLRTGSPRSIVLAVELMFLLPLGPFAYFAIKQLGFDLWPAVGTLFVVLAPLVYICWRPPRKAWACLSSKPRDPAA